MNRRKFLLNGSFISSGLILFNGLPSYAQKLFSAEKEFAEDELYKLFRNPEGKYRPFARWWWNGDKVEKAELARELRLMKAAGIGGVEINPIEYPYPDKMSDMGIKSIEWLSDEWMDMLQFTFNEAESLGMTCDLLVGTGFPFGGEFLQDGDRTQIMVIGVKKFSGPLKEEYSLFDLYKEADPKNYTPYSGRTTELISVKLVPDPITDLKDVVDLSDQIKNGVIKVSVPAGDYALYALVRMEGFQEVIVGAPGGRGPVVNHFSKEAVRKYLNRISDKVNEKLGGFPPNFRSFFIDSLEIEGANWSKGMAEEFIKRRGYDVLPYLPFILHKIGRMGNDYEPGYIAKVGDELEKELVRVRYDWALTNAEVFRDNFVQTYVQWCRDNKVKSRAQAYGRGYFLLEGSFEMDIPECESWLKYGLGKDISETEYTRYPWHRGQGYTMINKYVSSAAHLKGKKLISSEELTNTEMVFNESLELYKIAGDQSTISGVTYPVYSGFNYSPPDAPFPGWIRWGQVYSERNTMAPFIHLYSAYRTRLAALLQQGTMFAEIGLLPPIPDMWGKLSAQNEPFPQYVYPNYQVLIWESIHQNGNACDYVSEQVINDSDIRDGYLYYGSRRYHTIFLIEVRAISVPVLQKLYDFVTNGGKVICIETYPDHYPGWNQHEERDGEVKKLVEKLKEFKDRFILVRKPAENFCEWFGGLQVKYGIKPYVQIKKPTRYITQVRYQMPGNEVFFFINSSDEHDYELDASFLPEIVNGNQAWLWDGVTGERFKLKLNNNKLSLPMGPATSAIIVFNKDRKGKSYNPIPLGGDTMSVKWKKDWEVELNHYDGQVLNTTMSELKDLKEIPEYAHFAGTVTYKNTLVTDNPGKINYLNLGKVYGVSTVKLNGKDLGTKWFGHRIYPINHLLGKGENILEINVVTVMVNYMKTLTDNKVAQYWTNEKNKNQPLQSLGLAGPVTAY